RVDGVPHGGAVRRDRNGRSRRDHDQCRLACPRETGRPMGGGDAGMSAGTAYAAPTSAAQGGTAKKRDWRDNPRRIRLLKLLGLAAFLGTWQLVGAQRPQFYSTPTRVVAELRRQV